VSTIHYFSKSIEAPLFIVLAMKQLSQSSLFKDFSPISESTNFLAQGFHFQEVLGD
jgi:hypothetical protein